MGKMTHLEITQSILSSMDSDDVNSISDTEEALQVSQIIQDTYNELMTRDDWNHLKLPIPLISVSDSDYPTTLQIPDSVVSIQCLRYDVRTSSSDPTAFKKLTYVEPNEFLDKILTRDSTAANVNSLTVKGSTAPLYVFNDRPPSIWTSFDEDYITMDANLDSLNTTVLGNKSIVYASSLPTYSAVDVFVPDLPATMFPQFLAECKKACFFYLKESQTPVDEKRAFRGQSINTSRKTRAHERRSAARYGRR